MLEAGALEEVRALAARRLDPVLPAMKAHGVPWLIRHLNGEISLDEAAAGAIMDTRRYAKRQLTWFRNQMTGWPAVPSEQGSAALESQLTRLAEQIDASRGDFGKIPPMTRDEAVGKLKSHVAAVRALGATSLYLFGSVARNEAGVASDLDVFIDYDPASRFNAFDLVDIKQLLEARLGLVVDVTTRDSLHPMLRGRHSEFRGSRVLMSRKTAPVLDEMIKAIDGIEAAVAGKTFAEFQGDWLLKHGVQRGLEIISEASRRLPADMKAPHPAIRWPAIAGIGNVLRHDYHAISDK